MVTRANMTKSRADYFIRIVSTVYIRSIRVDVSVTVWARLSTGEGHIDR